MKNTEITKTVTIKRVSPFWEQMQNNYNKQYGNKEDTHPSFTKVPLYGFQAMPNPSGGLNYGMDRDKVLQIYQDYTGNKAATMLDVQKFYENLYVPLTNGFITLDISVKADGMPKHHRDYIIYSIAKTRPDIAPSANMIADKHAAYIDDPEVEETQKLAELEKESEAVREFERIKENEGELRKYLTIAKTYGFFRKFDAHKATLAQLKIKAKEFVDDSPEHFLQVINDKRATDKYLVEQLVEVDLIKRDAKRMYYYEELVFNTIDEVVNFLNNQGNKAVKQQLVSTLEKKQEASLKAKS